MFLLVIFFAVFILGCKKSKKFSIPLGMSAKINNLPWSSGKYTAEKYFVKSALGDSLEELSILCEDSTCGSSSLICKDISFVIHNHSSNNITVGSYSIVPNTVSAGYDNYPISAEAISGEIILTKISSNNVQGTFNFTAVDNYNPAAVKTYSITEGQFNVNLQ